MPLHALEDWVAHLRAVAGPVATSPPPARGEVGIPFAAVAGGVLLQVLLLPLPRGLQVAGRVQFPGGSPRGRCRARCHGPTPGSGGRSSTTG